MCLVPRDTSCCAVPYIQKVLLSHLVAKAAWQTCLCCMAHLCCGVFKALDAVEHHMQELFARSSG